MQRSFKDRLAALEALEAAREAAEAAEAPPLTAADADALDDDEVLDEACWGWSAGWLSIWSMACLENRIGVHATLVQDSPDYWHRVAARAEVLRRGRVLIPATPEQLVELIRQLDAGDLFVRSFEPARDVRQYGNQQVMTMCGMRERTLGIDDPRHAWPRLLRQTLDGLYAQTGMAFCQSTEAARAVLGDVLEQMEKVDR